MTSCNVKLWCDQIWSFTVLVKLLGIPLSPKIKMLHQQILDSFKWLYSIWIISIFCTAMPQLPNMAIFNFLFAHLDQYVAEAAPIHQDQVFGASIINADLFLCPLWQLRRGCWVGFLLVWKTGLLKLSAVVVSFVRFLMVIGTNVFFFRVWGGIATRCRHCQRQWPCVWKPAKF